jgi:RimJ/RimL family protein N-acetyltransferase
VLRRVAAHNPGSLRVLEKHGFEVFGEEHDGDIVVCVLRLDGASD